MEHKTSNLQFWVGVGLLLDFYGVNFNNYLFTSIPVRNFIFRFCSQKSSKLVPGVTLDIIEK